MKERMIQLRALLVSFGKAAGASGVLLGALCLLAVLCFRFPHHLVHNDARPFYVENLDFFRGLLRVCLMVSAVLGGASVLILRSKRLGVATLTLCAGALLLGGPSAEAFTDSPVPITFALDYFILSLLLLAVIFVPMERIWPLRRQKVFRRGWQTDLAHFFTNHVSIQILAFISIVPVQLLFSEVVKGPFQRVVASQPGWLQFLEILFVVDLTSYWVHRAFHQVPTLWRFHAIHHSVEEMDWLAGSRLHLVDVVVTRLFGFLPIFLCGFEPAPFYAYLGFVSFHAVYIHANVSHRFPFLRRVLTTPEFHHWHHAAEPEAVDKNFAVLLSFIDSMFGTAHRPGRWPSRYGVMESPPPSSYRGQFVYPFKR